MNRQQKLSVVVVGAGIIGASIAYYLSRRKNVTVTVLERHQPGLGASSHSFAWINSFGKEPVSYHHFNRRSMDIWHRFAHSLGTDVGFHCGGELHSENTVAGVEALGRRVRQLQAWGYPCRMMAIDELRELEPCLSADLVSGASFSDIDGQVDASKVIDACLQKACERGAVVHVQTPVTGLCLDKNNRIEAVKTPKGEINCDTVILASGVKTTELAAMADVDIPQQQSPGVVIRTDARPPVLQTVCVLHLPAIDKDRPEIHLRQLTDGTFRIGQGSQESLNQDDSQEHADDLLSRAIHYLPALAGGQAIPVPVGYRPMPIDGLPVLGFSEAVPNFYIALMHSGITLAPLVGELVTLEIADHARVEMLNPYRPERFC